MLSIGAALGIGSVVSGLFGASQNKKAVDSQVEATEKGIEEQARQFDLTREDTAPWRKAGEDALGRLSGRIDRGLGSSFGPRRGEVADRFLQQQRRNVDRFARQTGAADDRVNRRMQNALSDIYDGERSARDDYMRRVRFARDGMYDEYNDIRGREFEADPGYQFRRDEGQRALERSAAARTGALSSASMKDMDRFSQGLASQEYANFDARRYRDSEQARSQATQRFGVDSGIAGQFYGAESNDLQNRYNRRMGYEADLYNRTYGRSGDMLQANSAVNAQANDARMGNLNAEYGRMMDRNNLLASMAGQGQTAVSLSNNAGMNAANNISDLYGNMGAAQAAGAINNSNILSGTMDNLFGIAGAASNGLFQPNQSIGSLFGFGNPNAMAGGNPMVNM